MSFGGRMAVRLVPLWMVAGAWLTGCGGEAGADAGASTSADTVEAQLARGGQLYEERCATCHQPGGIGPELTATLLATRGTALTLFDDIRSTMPYDAPGSLTEQQYLDITAFLLSDRGLVELEVVLSRDNAGDVRLGSD